MILVIDNYDSFTYNLVQYFERARSEEVRVVRRNDAGERWTRRSHGARWPIASACRPARATPDVGRDLSCRCSKTVRRPDLPILGVCLGHQAIGQAYGGEVVRAHTLMHGKTSPVRHAGEGLFEGLEDGFTAARYHSLAVARDTLPATMKVTAWTDDGEIMGLSHAERAVHGVQFHPESIATEGGHRLLANFLKLAGRTPRAVAA